MTEVTPSIKVYDEALGEWVFVASGAGSGGPSGSGGHSIQDEGSPLPAQTGLNFVGAGVTVTNDASNARTNVTIAGGSGSGHVIQDEGSSLPTQAALNFTGTGVTVTNDAANSRTNVAVTGGTGAVSSVNGKTGVVVLTAADVDADITGTPVEGALVSWDGVNRQWVTPSPATAVDIPYDANDSVAEAIAALMARVAALETTGPPVANTSAPTISGTYQVGQVITTSNGTWLPTPDSYTYQWRRGGAAISGATSSSYTLISADIGTDIITCVVTAAKAGYSSGTASADPIDVTGAPPAPMTIVGAVSQGAANSSTTRTITCPTGIDPGDLILLIGVSASGLEPQVITGITGLTEEVSRQVSGHDAKVWSKIAVGDEDGDVITCSSGTSQLKVSLAVIVLRSAGGTLQVKQKPFIGGTGGLLATTPTVIATQASYELALGITSTGDTTTAQTITGPNLHTEITKCVSVGISGGRTSIVVSHPTLTLQNSGVTLGGDTINWTPGSAHTVTTLAIGFA